MTFKYKFQVRGYELDSFGHVNNAVYLNYYEQARWVMMQELGLLDFFKKSNSFLIVAKAQLKYIKELNLLDNAYVISSYKIAGFFVIFNQEVRNEKNEKINTASIKCLFVNKERLPVDVPYELRKTLIDD